jgi:hypothetical protein
MRCPVCKTSELAFVIWNGIYLRTSARFARVIGSLHLITKLGLSGSGNRCPRNRSKDRLFISPTTASQNCALSANSS